MSSPSQDLRPEISKLSIDYMNCLEFLVEPVLNRRKVLGVMSFYTSVGPFGFDASASLFSKGRVTRDNMKLDSQLNIRKICQMPSVAIFLGRLYLCYAIIVRTALIPVASRICFINIRPRQGSKFKPETRILVKITTQIGSLKNFLVIH